MKYSLGEIRQTLQKAKQIWLFGKGPSFNETFKWGQALQPGHIRIGISQAIEYVKDPYLGLMYSPRVQETIPEHFQNIIYSEVLPGCTTPHSSGQYAIQFLGETGVKHILACGFDILAQPDYFKYGYGFNYTQREGKYSGLRPVQIKDFRKFIESELAKYGISIQHIESEQKTTPYFWKPTK